MKHSYLAIIGAGPTGLEAALAAIDAGLSFTLYEAAAEIAGHIRSWGHVRLFSPWRLSVSDRMRRHLEAEGHQLPAADDETCPTGSELIERLLQPIALLPSVRRHIVTGVRAREIGRAGLLKHEEIGSQHRAERPFRLLLEDSQGVESIATAKVVMDCTGTYGNSNKLGDGGIAAPGEVALDSFITRQLPDLERQPKTWANKTVLLVGAGHSAQTAAVALDRLAARHPGTRVVWALRRSTPTWQLIEGDPLPERAALTREAMRLAGGGSRSIETRCGVVVEALEQQVNGRVRVSLRHADGSTSALEVDRILSLTGSVGDHTLYRQLQVHECYATSGPMKLAAALLGSASDDCLEQTAHGVETLLNPEPDFFILGAKSYGRSASFLMRTGWEQVRDVFALLD